MPDQDFVHLHVHTEYSLLDGLSDIKKLVSRAKDLEMPAMAITDHGVMFGVIDFYREAKKAGVQPIIGMEGYLAPRGMRDKDARLDKSPYHLLMLARNVQGYRNLCKIATAAQLEGYYYKPRIDRDFLAAHSEGLVVTSGCLGAQIPSLVMEGRDDAAREMIDWYLQIFGRENFFLELQSHDIPELPRVNEWLVDIGRKDDVRFVATNDVHYVLSDDYDAHDTLLCVQTGALKSETGRMSMTDNSYFLSSQNEMWSTFGHIDGGSPLTNTLLVAEMCRDLTLDDKEYHLPIFPVPHGFSETEYMRYLCEKGLAWRFGDRAYSDPVLRERLDYELGTIDRMGFNTYFLIVWDLCEFARHADIWWNVRGSGAGSLAAYCLGITNIDPIQNNLLFERFLNPGRVTMPDIDMDFPDDRRADMIDYTVRKYGEDKVAAIITFGTLGAKAAVRDVGRAYGMDLSLVNQAAGMIPTEPKPKPIHTYIEDNPELSKLYKQNDELKQVMDMAASLQGVSRHSSVHAAGVIVADKPLVEYIPLSRQTKDDDTLSLKQVTQFPMETCESIGLLKVDFLGLSTLTIMRRASDLIQKHHDILYTMDNIPYRPSGNTLQDEMLEEAFHLLSRGDTIGVFQVESTGMQQMLREMRPNKFENIVAAVALYRPGPMDYIPTYNARMHGDEVVKYHHPQLESILDETYGIMVYQEQIMQVASGLFGYSLGDADLMRRAVSKKKKEDLLKHKEIFLQRGPELDTTMTPEIAERIFDDIEFFANYGFNKCLTGDTLVIDADTGRQYALSTLANGEATIHNTLSLDTASGKLRSSAVQGIWQNGVKPVFRVTTRLGKQIHATANHPFYTIDGWRNLENLSVGDFIAAPRVLPVANTKSWPDYQLITLGHLLAEGNLCHTTGVYYYTADDVLLDDYVQHMEQFENSTASVSVHKSTYSVYSKRWERSKPQGLVDWIKSLDLWGKDAYSKHFPDEVFELNFRSIALLIARMWEGDGHISMKGRSAFYATSSETLARQLHHLLLRLGIVSRIRKVNFPYRDGRIGWQVFITGAEHLHAFSNSIGNFLITAKNRSAIAEICTLKVDASSKDVIPLAIKTSIRELASDRGTLWKKFSLDTGIAVRELYPTATKTKSGFRRETIARIAEYFDSDMLRSAAYSDLYWDRIVSIEYVGEEPTYDLTIEGTHNFVANDLIVHNSHAADYAVITVQSAFLKAHYAPEYMAALLSVYFDAADKVTTFLSECKRLAIPILPPSINASALDFDIEYLQDKTRAIRFGLAAIKNAGVGALNMILNERNANGIFTSLDDLCRRVDLRVVGKRPLESLIKVGALDEFGTRATLINALDRIVQHSISIHKIQESGQVSMFGGTTDTTSDLLLNLPAQAEVSRRDVLDWEKELLGIYLSSHPIDPIIELLDTSQIWNSIDISNAPPEAQDRPISMVGLVSGLRKTVTKNKDMMAIATLEDKNGTVNAVLFPRTWSRFEELMIEGDVVLISGTLDLKRGDPQIVVDSVTTKFDMVISDQKQDDQPPQIQAIMNEPEPLHTPPKPVPVEPVWTSESGVLASAVEPPLWDDEPAPLANGNGSHDLYFDDEVPAQPPMLVTLRFWRNGDDKKDALRMRRVVGKLTEFPGNDRFEIILSAHEGEDSEEEDIFTFEHLTTQWCDVLALELQKISGVEIVSVEALPVT